MVDATATVPMVDATLNFPVHKFKLCRIIGINIVKSSTKVYWKLKSLALQKI